MVTAVRPLQAVTQGEGVNKAVVTDGVALRFTADQASGLGVVGHQAFKSIGKNVRRKAVVGDAGVDSVRLAVQGIGNLLCTVCTGADSSKREYHCQSKNQAKGLLHRGSSLKIILGMRFYGHGSFLPDSSQLWIL